MSESRRRKQTQNNNNNNNNSSSNVDHHYVLPNRSTTSSSQMPANGWGDGNQSSVPIMHYYQSHQRSRRSTMMMALNQNNGRYTFPRMNGLDRVRKIVQEEGRTARNLVQYSLPLQERSSERTVHEHERRWAGHILCCQRGDLVKEVSFSLGLEEAMPRPAKNVSEQLTKILNSF